MKLYKTPFEKDLQEKADRILRVFKNYSNLGDKEYALEMENWLVSDEDELPEISEDLTPEQQKNVKTTEFMAELKNQRTMSGKQSKCIH